MHTVLNSPQVLSTPPLSCSVCTRDWVVDDEGLAVTAEHTIQIFVCLLQSNWHYTVFTSTVACFQDLLLLSYAWLAYSAMHPECSFSACLQIQDCC